VKTSKGPTQRATGAAEVHGVAITHPEKVLWPADGVTKLDLARYYERVAPVLLRYAARRPLTLRPFPQGIDRPGFYLKNAPQGTPPWQETFADVAQSTGETVRFIVARDARTLVWLAQFNAPEVHAWLSTVDHPDTPDWAVLDLDAHGVELVGGAEGADGGAAAWQAISRAARAVRGGLDRAGLRSFPKLSGQSGVHVLVPLDPVHDFDTVRGFFEAFARDLSARHPDLLTADYVKDDRRGRILIDYAQNARAKTTVAPYSVRPKPGAPVAAPVRWDELDDPDLRPNRWTITTIFDRLNMVGDLLEPALAIRQRLLP
jgi:bifunctional non-homologous end joining protein LigD